MKKSQGRGKPFFVWLNATRMHLYTRLNDKWRYAAEKYTSEADVHGSGMLQHDHDVGARAGPSCKTTARREHDRLVLHRQRPRAFLGPHGATTPFRGEKMTTYEGGVRVVSMLRWPGTCRRPAYCNGIQAHMDLFTTLAAAAGVPDVVADA